MSSSLCEVTYDLLSYEGHGNYSRFDRCFSKACQYFSLQLDEPARRKLRTYAFHFLRVTGYLEVFHSNSVSKWSVAPETLVQRGESDYIFIGGTHTSKRLKSVFSNDRIKNLHPWEGGLSLPKDISLFPDVIQITATAEEIIKIGRAIGLPISLSYQDQLFERLPSILPLMNSVLARSDGQAIFEPNSTSRYVFSTGLWERYSETRPLTSGLFRKEFDYSPPEYYIANEPTRNFLEVSRVVEREWVYVCALSKLLMKSTIKYDRETKVLSLLMAHEGLRIPTLLEKCFRSGTLLNPRLFSGFRMYENITEKNIWKLIDKLPIFKVE